MHSLAQCRSGQPSKGGVGRGAGIAGRLMESVAAMLERLESHLILGSGEKGCFAFRERLSQYLARVEQLLSRPRYLFILIMGTFVVIL